MHASKVRDVSRARHPQRATGLFTLRVVRSVRLATSTVLLVACHDSVSPNGFPPDKRDPVEGNWVAVGVGSNTSCALDRDGRVFCWGVNDHGLLGTGAVAGRVETPRAVEAPSLRFTQISVGAGYQCALTADGSAYCWGDNSSGQLGTGDGTGNAIHPTAVVGGIRFRSITAGFNATCGIDFDDRGFCWGDHIEGQLGIGPTSVCDPERPRCPFRSPMPIAGNLRFVQISVGFWHACGIARDGTAYCWGDDSEGALGNHALPSRCGSSLDRLTCNASEPRQVSTQTRFTAISAGMMYSCGIAVGGAAYCWGAVSGDRGIGASHLGNATYAGYYGPYRGSGLPVPVEGALRFREITTGLDATCALTVDGTAVCWGSNNFGQMGFASMAPDFTTTPRAVRMPRAAAAPARGLTDHACAVTTTGRIWCWGGWNAFGELGSPPIATSLLSPLRDTPTPVDGRQ